MCANDSHSLSDQTLSFIKSHPLMDRAVPAFGGQPISDSDELQVCTFIFHFMQHDTTFSFEYVLLFMYYSMLQLVAKLYIVHILLVQILL